MLNHPLTRYGALALLFMISIMVNLIDQNVEFFRDEGYASTARSAFFIQLFSLHPAEASFLTGLGQDLKTFIAHFLFQKHGGMSNLFGAMVFMAMDLFNVPFTYQTFLLPTVLASALSCCLLFSIFVRIGLTPIISACLVCAFLFSPMYLGMSRGIGTNLEIFRYFSHILFVYSYVALSQAGRAKWLLFLPAMIVLFSDAVFYLWFAGFFAAVFLTRILQHEGRPHFGRLLSSAVFVIRTEAAIIIAILIGIAIHTAAYFIYPYFADSVQVPMFAATSRHGLDFSIPDLPTAITALNLLLGVVTPLLVLVGLGMYLFCFRSLKRSMDHLGLILFLGYFLLFYFLTDPSDWGVLTAYQGYILFPLLLLVACGIFQMQKSWKWVGWVIPAVLLVSSIAGSLSFIWNLPIAGEVSVARVETWGAKRPVLGVKSMGYLLRLHLMEAAGQDGEKEFDIFVYRNEALMADAGLITQGEAGYFDEIAIQAPLSVYGGLANQGAQIRFYTGTDTRVNYHSGLPERGLTQAEPAGMAVCESDICIYALPADEVTETLFPYLMEREGRAIGTLWLPEPDVGGYASGTYDSELLEQAFEQDFHQFSDFFPTPRPLTR